jgi:hypothetical protein
LSIEVMNQVWKHSQAVGRARLVLLAIADHQGEIGAWPSLDTLAKMVNASTRSVQRDIDYLQELGELKVDYQNAPSQGRYKSNLYWVTLGVTNTDLGVTNTGQGVTTVGVQTLNRTLKEEPLSNYRELFDEFWKEYPRKSDKRAALRAFNSAITRASFEDILAGTIGYANDPNLPEARFIKHPATWLNADAWENPPLPALKKSGNKEAQKKKLDEWLKSLDQ